MITPEEIVKLIRAVGLTYEDMWDDKLPYRMKDGTEGLGNTNDLIRMCFFNKTSNAIILPCLGRGDMRLEWLIVINDDDPEVEWEGFWLKCLELLKLSDQESSHGIEGIGQMTADQYMDAIYGHNQMQSYGPREGLVAIRRGQYNIARHTGNIDVDMSFREFCKGDYWLVDVAEDEGRILSAAQQIEVDSYFKDSIYCYLASHNGDVMNDGSESLDVSTES